MIKKQDTVLVVEDDKYLSKVYADGLGLAGFKVFTAKDGEAGLKMACEKKPDIIILDLMLPVMQGDEVLRHLKERLSTSKIPVIILSNRADIAGSDNCIKNLGAAEYLVKINVLMEDLVKVMNKHLKK